MILNYLNLFSKAHQVELHNGYFTTISFVDEEVNESEKPEFIEMKINELKSEIKELTNNMMSANKELKNDNKEIKGKYKIKMKYM